VGPTISHVSTVLRPVGPNAPWVYWIRRIVLLAVIVLVVVLIVALLPSGGSPKPAASHHHNSPGPSQTPTTTALALCDPSVVTLALGTDSDTYHAGDSPKLSGVFSNPSTTACKIVASPAKQVWRVMSGTDLIWTTKGCASAVTGRTIKLEPGATKTISIVWDGRRIDPGCTAGATALPGEYVLHAKIAGITGKIAVFHVTS